jgi:hypothetical protein
MGPYQDALRATLNALARAKALHERSDYGTDCETCSGEMKYVPWPCPTRQALDSEGDA